MAARSRTARRQRREEIRADVRRAVLELTRERSYAELTVEEIATAAGLSRSAFYFYYRDKQDVIAQAAEEIAGDLFDAADRFWHGDATPEQLVRDAVTGIVNIYAEHSGMLRLATDVATDDPDLGSLFDEILQRFIDATAEHLRAERAAGRMRPNLGPDLTAALLVWMIERSCYMGLGRAGRTTDELIEALTDHWVTALYPDAA